MDLLNLFAIFIVGIILVKLLAFLQNEIVFPYLVSFVKDSADNLKELSGGAKWAVITGATDGIGKAYAKQLAKKKFNLVLVSRNQEKLDATAEEIKEQNSTVDVKTVVFDFTTADSEVYTQVFEEASKLDVGILVNNVGASFEYPEVLHEVPGGSTKARDMVVVNCISPMMMSRIFLAQMIERNKGIIINIASAAAFNPTPYLSIYSASKVFVDYLTRSNQLEYRKMGIIFQCVLPYYVATKLAGLKRSSFLVPSPDTYAASAIRTIGWTDRTTGYIVHEFLRFFLSLLPDALLNIYIENMMQKIRNAALRKKAKQQ